MKFISYIISSIFAVVFFSLLLIFHPIQWLGLKFFGQKGHQKVVNIMNWFLIKSLLILGIRVQVENEQELPENTSLIFVSNHQSTFDISPIIWHFRKNNPKFVSKKELGKGIPSISFNLRHGGAALIDRKDPRQALTELANFSKTIDKNNWSAAIFPEGTRSVTGVPKSFSPNGLKMIAKYNPEAYIVPLTINNSWKVFKYGKFPLGLGSPIKIKTHTPIKVNSLPFKELIDSVENTIKEAIDY
ncbi:1-acyl-sn-glycerol-3-phosphate acyltransferase [Tenacibaculum finnmarkense genomovar finnmarkense]|uniref:Glycerol acyltransferase n=1 Tax=Tenacibaculum dicentrarchi TaxID=669041 RepID=A0ABM9NQX0_9FLAO|nr:lysophospholipid acyltransferase family protein [Tenacibaculum finnmarkense]MCD8404002.1 1-acyl-sn-glycerol-3-phosphate acyltransferase [Tenacibaculum dicentrarchi]MBE7660234.1 1-acyl-sn-glycerol-3-phosphate acyltransferase [Tenacibaculum finnmarkense genomovar finnmarkense]MCD8413816.1 1-acyl-sn-glycerol-3-phosphate acyltransferase [Tenacibaculum dicentrarchi]MCD8416749.1 1-acyl-sn-glycerol-3-phosphate acyltransferase [Tenacibaculum finnmarkense genomovar finnmarkense]MCD8419546.1 1-acyl-s